MKKRPKIFLVCNAHIDPVWLWQWQEGVAEAISTFRSAADFCEKYDSFVFNHNEALLYGWVEQYEPELFERIKKLVKLGKWHIMGGWYLQPDCVLPSGESFVRQIEAGRRYFDEKFGVKPVVAVNFDPFGHSRGLVQILSKTGYNGYLFMRGADDNFTFRWKGFDDSEIIGHRIFGGYGSQRGHAAEKVSDFIDKYINKASAPAMVNMVTWGVGDHGGGASIPDLDNIDRLIKDTENIDIFQGTPEQFFDEVDKAALPVVEKSLCHCMVGCYTSMARIKQMHRKLENMIEICEQMMAHAAFSCGFEPDIKIDEAKRDLMFAQFHDVLPGSAIRRVEEEQLGRLSHGITIADELMTRAFFALCSGQAKPKDGEIPIMVYNPHPYAVKTVIETEFSLASQNWTEGEYTIGRVYDEAGTLMPTQNEKPSCTMNLDWYKKVSFMAELKPCSVNRFNCRLEVLKNYSRIARCDETADSFVIPLADGVVRIGKKSGLIEELTVKGISYIKSAGKIKAYRDNEDPWGMTVDRFDDFIQDFELMEDSEVNTFTGYPEEKTPNVRVIENGEARCIIQAFFKFGKTTAIVSYTVSKHLNYVDVSVRMLSNVCNCMIKYEIDTFLDGAEFLGQTAFGTQMLENDGREITYQQWCALSKDGKRISVLNNGMYAGSSDGKKIELSLLRTPIYSAHPIGDRQLAEHDRYSEHIDMGERTFEFRIVCADAGEPIDTRAQSFNQRPISLAFFPSGMGEKPAAAFETDNQFIIMTSARVIGSGRYMFRLFNSTDQKQTGTFKMFGHEEKLEFTKFEVRTFICENSSFTETDMLGNIC